jgi:hypothetical protein
MVAGVVCEAAYVVGVVTEEERVNYESWRACLADRQIPSAERNGTKHLKNLDDDLHTQLYV